MVVLDQPLSRVHCELDLVATPVVLQTPAAGLIWEPSCGSNCSARLQHFGSGWTCCRRTTPGPRSDVRPQWLVQAKGVARGFLDAALGTPVTVGDIAAQGGARGLLSSPPSRPGAHRPNGWTAISSATCSPALSRRSRRSRSMWPDSARSSNGSAPHSPFSAPPHTHLDAQLCRDQRAAADNALQNG